MPTFVKASFRAGKAVKGYMRRSLVKEVRRTAKKFAAQTTVRDLQVKYDRSYRILDKSGHAPGYDFNGYVRRVRARALGRKTSIYG